MIIDGLFFTIEKKTVISYPGVMMQRMNRLGTFIVFLGAGAVILFILSDSTHLPDYRFLFWGVGLLVVGALMKILQPKAEKPKSTRFRILHGRNPDEK